MQKPIEKTHDTNGQPLLSRRRVEVADKAIEIQFARHKNF